MTMASRMFPRLALALMAGLTQACGENRLEWKEEVKLQSGDVIVVQRTAKTRPFGEVGGSGGWENEGMTMQIIQPAHPDNPPLWDARFVPLLFDREANNGQWFVVATFFSCQSWYELGRPALPYTEFRLTSGLWVQGPLNPSLLGREGNMLTSIKASGERDLTLQSKEDRMNDPRIAPKYKRILAEWKTTC